MIKIRQLTIAGLFASSAAHAYPIDCAILLCLAGGFPPSVECTAAKVEFIRRITPFPIEPPLQVWNCPMGISAPSRAVRPLVYDASFARGFNHSPPEPSLTNYLWAPRAAGYSVSGSFIVPAQSYPSGNIADPAYDFVRSIKVWHLDYAQEQTRDECVRRDQSRLGSYDHRGAYVWQEHTLRLESIGLENGSVFGPDTVQVSSYSWNVPLEATIHEADPATCEPFHYRAVFVAWQDYFGAGAFHEVRY